MPYGTLKVDNIVFTNGGVDQTITVSGIVASTSGNLTVTGTISGNIIRGGTTISGATVTGSAGQFGNLTAVSGTFTTISGGTYTLTSGVFASGTVANPSISFAGDPNTGIYSPGADQVAISTNGTNALTIDSSQRVGIGTNSPSYLLHVVKNSNNSQPTAIIANSSSLGSAAAYLAVNSDSVSAGLTVTSSAWGNYGLFKTQSAVLDAGGTASTVLGIAGQAGILFGVGANPYSEVMRIDSSGRVLVGTFTARSPFANNPLLQVENVGANNAVVGSFTFNGNNTSGPNVTLLKSRGSAVASNTAVQNNDILGEFYFSGTDGTNAVAAAAITTFVDGTPGANDMPGRLVFGTTADGASSPTARVTIDSSGKLLVGTTVAGTSRAFIQGGATGNSTYAVEGLSVAVGGNTANPNGRGVVADFGAGGAGDPATTYGATINLGASGVGNWGIRLVPSNASFVISDYYPGGTYVGAANPPTERMRIDSSGNVGINTTNPGSTLDVRFGTSPIIDNGAGLNALRCFTTSALAVNTGGAISLGGVYHNNGDVAAFGQIAGRKENSTSNDLSGYLQFATNTGGGTMVERARIDSAGRLGIGTSSPGYLLDVASSVLQVGNATDAFIQYKSSAGNWHVGAVNSNAYAFYSGTYGSGIERARIDSSGRLLVGTSSALLLGTASSNYAFNIETLVGSGVINHSIGAVRHGNNIAAGGPVITLARSNGNAVGAVTAVSNGDLLGRLEFVGANGTNFTTTGASIASEVDGSTISTSSMPGRLVFSTTADGASSPTERMRINNAGYLALFNRPFQAYNTGGSYDMGGTGPGVEVFAGLEIGRWQYHMGSLVSAGAIGPIFRYTQNSNWASPTTICTLHTTAGSSFNSVIRPGVDNTYACGESGARWSAIWAANGTIQTSDVRDKTDIEPVSHGIEFIRKLNPVTYKWKIGSNQVIKDKDGGPIPDKNGNPQTVAVPGQRTHWGFAAQEVKEVVDELGLDFGGWVLTDVDNPDSQQALRYDQFIAPLTKALQEAIAKIETLEAKVAALEAS